MIQFSGQTELLNQQLHQAHRNAINSELSAQGLGEIGHPMLLTILNSFGNDDCNCSCPSQQELAKRLHISPAAVANSLKSLEKGEYIRREPVQGDARRNQVLLTEKGRRAVEGCQCVFETVSHRMLAGFTPEENEVLLAFRQRMLDNLRNAYPPSVQTKEES
ncbi:MAG: MarR family transcriptional regulator [Lawsonibacter sp.]|nr:MarR family transcriptional regulator [Lawsonibacter sp.]